MSQICYTFHMAEPTSRMDQYPQGVATAPAPDALSSSHRLPGVQGRQVAGVMPGEDLSPPAAVAAERVLDLVLEELSGA